jgi:hypothetical protein
MYNFSRSVTDHDDFLPAVIMVQSPCYSSQCTSTHSATEDVYSRHYLRPGAVAPTTSTVPQDTSTVAPTTSTVPQDTCTVDQDARTVDQDADTVDPDTCAVASSARTVAPATSTLASSAASVATSTRVMAPATVTVATGSVTVTTSTVCDAGLAHARFNHGLACGPTSHTESIMVHSPSINRLRQASSSLFKLDTLKLNRLRTSALLQSKLPRLKQLKLSNFFTRAPPTKTN